MNREELLLLERDKLQHKLSKVQARRDHYARLYYRTLAQLNDTQWELIRAKNKIQQLQPQPVPSSRSALELHHSEEWRQPAFPTLPTLEPLTKSVQLSNSLTSPPPQPAISNSTTALSHRQLTGLELLNVLGTISSPVCCIRTLEIADSRLGQPEVMKMLCADIVKNCSITSLSLPDNRINGQSLSVLLEAIHKCSRLKELLLRNNLIGVDCVDMIKQFLSCTTLDSLVLTGNEIEQCSHMLSGELPGEFSMEFSAVGECSSSRDTLNCLHV